jgi:Zn-dependent protease/CBS domain-containing protein
MGGGFRLGSVLGFEIRVDYSWFIIFFLVLWTLSAGFFPAQHPGYPDATYLAMGIAATLLFFASVLAHELSHSLVARRKGIPVEGITLFIFGGMAHTRMEFEDPADEFQVAGVGPLSSMFIAVLFYAAGFAGAAAGMGVPFVAVMQYLGFINLLLAVFNLLPGFPLDGGRLFRAAAWKATGDMRKATRWASNGGKILGYTLIALGLYQIFAIRGAALGGVWLVFIGWFIRMAADASYTQLVVQQSLRGVRAAQAMTPDPQSVPPDVTIQAFVDELVLHGRHQGYPVVEEGRAVGIITLKQVREVPREDWPSTRVRDAMDPATDALVVRPDQTMADVLEKLGDSRTGRVLVVRDGQLAGIITRTDLSRHLERMQLLEGRR